MNRVLLFFTTVFGALLLGAAPCQSQVLVYKLEFGNAKGVNFHVFEGGYVVVPLLGGAASFLLTSTEDGRTFSESSEGGKFFVAVTGSGEQRAVISATTGGETASGSIVALGEVNHIVRINSRTLTVTAKVAKTLRGALVSADDESEVTEVPIDGSSGSAGMADVKMSLDEDETNRSNKDDLSIEATIEHLKLDLERRGFSAAGTEEPDPEATTTPQ